MIRPILFLALALCTGVAAAAAERPFHRAELIFPLEHWHNHASTVVEAANGDLIVCWFHGSGERTADDVVIEGSRLRKGAAEWEKRFLMADTPDYPDTNCTMFIDPRGRLWLLWPAILANEWHTALMKYQISSDFLGEGAPKWERHRILHVTPNADFERAFLREMDRLQSELTPADLPEETRARIETYLEEMKVRAGDKLFQRLGWMTRAHPFVLEENRLIVPLYSDGFDCSLMAVTDDWGETWQTSNPIVGGGNIQPSIVRRQDGSLYALMRDNGLPPKRLHASTSRDRGLTWSSPVDSDLPNPGSGAEIIALRNGDWVLISNDTERGRHSLAVQISEDEGKTWPWKRHLELDAPGPEAGSYSYPSLIEARDGSLHATYSYHLRQGRGMDAEGRPARKSIKHAHFNTAWIRAESGAAASSENPLHGP